MTLKGDLPKLVALARNIGMAKRFSKSLKQVLIFSMKSPLSREIAICLIMGRSPRTLSRKKRSMLKAIKALAGAS